MREHLIQLHQILTERFAHGELRTLCFDLGVDYDDLPGGGKADKARELIVYLERRDRIRELLEAGKRLRPDVSWEEALVEWAQARLDADMARLLARRDQTDKARREMRGRQLVVNLRPLDVTLTFKDRVRETQALRDYLADRSVRLVSVVGRGGIGKTALASRVLADLECAIQTSVLPETSEVLRVDGILYLSARTTGLRLERIYADVARMLGEPTAGRLVARWADRDTPLTAKVGYLLETLQTGVYIILLDNLEDCLTEDGTIAEEGLRLFVERSLAQPSGARLIVTSREQVRIPAAVLHVARTIPLREGLPEDDAVALLRDLDPQGTLGLRDASEEELRHAAWLTRGIPRALEILTGMLHQDPSASLPRLLADERLFGERVVEQLVIEGYQRLGCDERRVMEALAIFDRPVAETAVTYLLYPWFPGLDARACLRRLVAGYFVNANRVTGEYGLHPLDRDYACRQLPDSKGPDTYDRCNLELRAADFYARLRKPESEWRSIEDLVPQLAEFEHRVRAGDYDSACRVLKSVDSDYLFLWGHYARLVELREKLVGRLTDPDLQTRNLGSLGRAYRALGYFGRAIELYEQALVVVRQTGDRTLEQLYLSNLSFAHYGLGQVDRVIKFQAEALAIARDIGNRRGEGAWLGNLGLFYQALGQVERAISLYEEALLIARETGFRVGEGRHLGNLGLAYCDLGQVGKAIKLYEEALAITREIGYPRREARDLGNLGFAYYSLGQIDRAIELYEDALLITREIGDCEGESYQLLRLGKALLVNGKLSEAQRQFEEALALDMPTTSSEAALALGIVLLLRRDSTARDAFGDAASRCRSLLGKTAEFCRPRYTLAAALVGQAVCDARWADEDERATLLAPALAEYCQSLETCAALGVVRDAVQDLELVCAAGIKGLAPAFELLEDAVEPTGTDGG